MNNEQGFSIITSTIRKNNKERIISNYINQDFINKELIIVINNDEIDIKDFSEYVDKDINIKVYKLPQTTTLGECLNFGISKSKYEYIAKFDDDDYYGKYYLKEAFDALKNRKGDIVGKSKIYYYLEEFNELRLYNGLENRKAPHIAGATLCFRKEVFENVKFRNLPSAVDTWFLNDCNEKRYKIFSMSKFNYIVFRSADINTHTWTIQSKQLRSITTKIKENIKFEESFKLVEKKI